MTPEALGARLVALLAPVEATPSVSGGQRFARATVDVPPESWLVAVRAARDDAELACDFFDWLSAVDELAEGFDVVAHLWSTRLRHGVLLRTRLPRADATVASVVDVYPGAAWHERETHEMFGIDFAGHGELRAAAAAAGVRGSPAAQGVRARFPGGQALAGREGTGRVGGRRWASTDPPAGCSGSG